MANSCEDLVIKKIILTGERGEPGPQGPPGDNISLPIAASDISVTNPGYNNAQEIFDALLYIEFKINSFTSGSSLYENRDAADISADFIIAFTWTYNKAVVSQTLVGPNEMTPVSLTINERTKPVTMTNFNTTSNFTLTATDEQGIVKTAVRTITFTDAVYYGDTSIPQTLDQDFIKNSLLKSLQVNNTKTITSTTVSNTYFWFATPVDKGTPVFTVNGLPADMEAPVVISVTSLGYTTDYNLYRTTNSNLGTLIFNIT